MLSLVMEVLVNLFVVINSPPVIGSALVGVISVTLHPPS